MIQKENEALEKIRHSAAHVMAEAVLKLFPGSKFAIGPAIENGFYYDFDLSRPIKTEDLAEIEKEMRRIVSGNHDFSKKVLTRKEALDLFKDQPYKIELINDLPENEEISVYSHADFVDLCRGPHIENTKEINGQAFKLMKTAGAYWRGDVSKPMLTRIYGTAWQKPQELKDYLAFLEEAEKRDHRKIGKDLDLFHIDEENPGQIFWHPHGWTIYKTLKNYVSDKIAKDGYVEVNTPFVMPQSLWEKSGHWEKYQENMFLTESEKRLFALKPMNCPGHVEIFKTKTRSYKDLPLRMAEFGNCTRNEASGALHGIMRVRGFVQDDGHIFCTEDQIESEVVKFCALLKDMYKDFGFEGDKIIVKFSTRPEKRVGSDESWDRSEAALEKACKAAGLDYEIQPGEGAFYGPKLEFTLVDALGRHWQCGTIQVDHQLPSADRLHADYIGDDNAKHQVVMLHRAVLGSLERFIGILLENFAGALPAWLQAQQAVVIPVAPSVEDYAKKVNEALQKAGLRSKFDLGNDRMNAKIRQAQLEKIPYMLVVGEKEMADGAVAVRFRDGRGQEVMKIEDFVLYAKDKIENFFVGI